MTFITSALGLFYIAAASLVLRRAYAEARWAGTPSTAQERVRTLLIALSASLYGAAGLALLLKSGLAVWLFAAGLALQALAYALLFGAAAAASGDARQSNQAWTAGMLSAAATAFSAYALRQGLLS
jgi:hypothetical protein